MDLSFPNHSHTFLISRMHLKEVFSLPFVFVTESFFFLYVTKFHLLVFMSFFYFHLTTASGF